MAMLNATTPKQYLERIECIPEDKIPEWGSLRKDTLIQHLIWTFEKSIDTDNPVRDQGNFVFRNIVRPLILNGLVPFPKNVKFKSDSGEETNVLTDGDLDTLHDIMRTFAKAHADGTLETAPHPVFGDIGPNGWAKFHIQHLNHHMKQFGA